MMENRLSRVAATVLIGGLSLLGASAAEARSSRGEPQFTPDHAPGTPLLAVVALREQRISIYDAKGKIMESPVSSGQTNYETPAGIYSIVQKEEEHHSNLYDDASMPFMERITWTGMALHAGVLPGYAASHGCVRLPESFAERLYGVTNLGMRVVVVREDIAPAEVPQPFMFGVTEGAKHKGETASRDGATRIYSAYTPQDSALRRQGLIYATKTAEAENAGRRVRDARLGISKKIGEAHVAGRELKAAEEALEKAEAGVRDLERSLEKASADRIAKAEVDKAQASQKLEAAQARLEAAKADAKTKADALAQAQADLKPLEVTVAAATEAAEEAKLNLSPVSVLISRKTQRLYIRRGNTPVFEAPVLIQDAGKPIGTFVFTALDQDASGDMRWNVVSMYKDPLNVEPFTKIKSSRGSEAAPANKAAAEAALKRLTLTQEAIERVSEVVLPGSSLIVSDEGPSVETGKDTDFILFMSGEPQGALAIRKHPERRGDGDWGRDGGDPWFSSRSYRARAGWWSPF